MTVDLKLARHAVALSRIPHFGKAAASLGISQPTLSRNVAALEQQLGLRLFDRLRSEVVATPAGSEVLRLMDQLLSRADQLSNQITMLRQDGSSHLRIVAGTMACDIAVYPALVEHLETSPSSTVEIIEREWAATLDGVLNDQAHIAITDVRPLPKNSELKVEAAGKIDFVLVCRRGHPLQAKAKVTAADIAEYRLIYQRIPIDWRTGIEHLDRRAYIEPKTGAVVPSITLSSCRAMLAIAAKTDALTFAHPSQIREEVQCGKLAIVPYRAPGARAQFGFVYKRSRPPSRTVRRFMTLVRHQFLRAALDPP